MLELTKLRNLTRMNNKEVRNGDNTAKKLSKYMALATLQYNLSEPKKEKNKPARKSPDFDILFCNPRKTNSLKISKTTASNITNKQTCNFF